MADAKKQPIAITKEKQQEQNLDLELEAFSQTTRKVKTILGEVLEYPRVGWIVEAQILRTVGRLLKQIPTILLTFQAEKNNEETHSNQDLLNILTNLTGQDLLEAISIICEEAPDEISRMVSLITRQEEDWIGENLDLEGIAEVLLPFFYERKLKIGKLISRWKEKFTPPSSTKDQ